MRLNTRFGPYGGTFVPEILYPALVELESAYLDLRDRPSFRDELSALLRDYAGRPTPLYRTRRLATGTKAKIYLKREDLLHGGAHKTNQVLGQALIARSLGKRRLIAETGAGQHGIATAMVGALFGMETEIYMGAVDAERQRSNVQRMELMGARVHRVSTGAGTLNEALNEALRDWSATFSTTHYLLGTAAGPHPYPTLVRELQRVIGDEARVQIQQVEGRIPDQVIACVGGGSNAIGMFTAFLDSSTQLIGVEAGGRHHRSGEHGATLAAGSEGILHGARTRVLQDKHGWVQETHSIAAGLDYPAVGPEHAHLHETGRAEYRTISDREALAAFHRLAREEGILPALESAHAVAEALKIARDLERPNTLLVCLSGRGEKDLATVLKNEEVSP